VTIPLEQRTPSEPATPNAPADYIASQVMSTLGAPAEFLRVKVRVLWPDHYRVNVLTGTSDAFAKVAHSYFLVARDGVIVDSTPALRRVY
jgi:hypothetical protein